MSVIVLVPVLRRPHRVAPTQESLRQTSPQARLLFICSPGDDEEIAAIDEVGAEKLIVSHPPGPGDYAKKINAGYRTTAEPFLFLGADDLAFRRGWLERALKPMQDERIGVVGTQDRGNSRVKMGVHSTHSLVRRSYVDQYGLIDEPGKVLYEGYEHEWVDDELVGTAKARNAWAFANGSVVEHLHFQWGKAPNDELYARAKERLENSRPLYLERKKLWSQSS